MILQGFDPLGGTVNDLVHFCECMEQTDEAEVKIPASKSTRKDKGNPKSDTSKKWKMV